jgi:hypothetical protein
MEYLTGEITPTKEVRSTRRKRVPLSHCLRQIPSILTWDRKRDSAVRSRRVTARVCAVEPQAFGTEGCGLPRWLQSFHHNASQQATSCNVLAASLLETSLSFSVIFDTFCTNNRAVPKLIYLSITQRMVCVIMADQY